MCLGYFGTCFAYARIGLAASARLWGNVVLGFQFETGVALVEQWWQTINMKQLNYDSVAPLIVMLIVLTMHVLLF